ncbi:hypothetical protein H1R20_g8874, partial [Candolleomyces eurysporus]
MRRILHSPPTTVNPLLPPPRRKKNDLDTNEGGTAKEKGGDTLDKARWWTLLQKQMDSFTHAYRFGEQESRDLIHEDLRVETVKVVYQSIKGSTPFAFTEYVLVSCPLAKYWFLPLPSEKVVQVVNEVNECAERLIAKGEGSQRLGDTLSSAVLYALQISQTNSDYSDSFTPLVGTIAKRTTPGSASSPADEARKIPLMTSSKHTQRWVSLCWRTVPSLMAGGEEGTQS